MQAGEILLSPDACIANLTAIEIQKNDCVIGVDLHVIGIEVSMIHAVRMKTIKGLSHPAPERTTAGTRKYAVRQRLDVRNM